MSAAVEPEERANKQRATCFSCVEPSTLCGFFRLIRRFITWRFFVLEVHEKCEDVCGRSDVLFWNVARLHTSQSRTAF